ncbi:MAG: cytochrome c family protein [Pseudomonadota bacterium]
MKILAMATALGALSMSMATMPTAAFADGHTAGDAAKGEKVFRRCQSCHMVGPDAKAKVGPALNGVIGRTAGSWEDYKYGDSLKAAGEAGLVWDEAEMFAYLEDPRAYLRAKLDDKSAKSKMAFKLRKEDQRADVIAYLKTFAEDGSPAAE